MLALVVALLVVASLEATGLWYFYSQWRQERSLRALEKGAVIAFDETKKVLQAQHAELMAALVQRHEKESTDDRQTILASPGAAAAAERVRRLSARAREGARSSDVQPQT